MEALAGSVDADILNQLLLGVDDLVEDLTRRFIAHPSDEPIAERIGRYADGFEQLADPRSARWAPSGGRTASNGSWRDSSDPGFRSRSPSVTLIQVELTHAADIVDVSTSTGRPLEEVGRLFFRAGSGLPPRLARAAARGHVRRRPGGTAGHRSAWSES